MRYPSESIVIGRRMALENAVSVAGVLLLSEATMTELPEPHKPEREGVEP